MDEIKVADYSVAKDRSYLPSHEWVLDNGDGTFTMGISDYAQKMLREISYIQYEDAGESFEEGEIITVVEALKATGDIYAPFDCELLENNESLEDEPEKVTDSPYGDGWLIKIKATSDNRSKLISPEDYAKVIEQELEDL